MWKIMYPQLGRNFNGVVHVCMNCGDYLNSARKYCDYCRTKSQRTKMNKENAEHLGITQEEWRKERLMMRSLNRMPSVKLNK